MVVRNDGERSAQGILPAAGWRQAGNFVFVSSIYPLDGSGNVAHTQSISPYVGDAEIAVQTRSCLEELNRVRKNARFSVDYVVG